MNTLERNILILTTVAGVLIQGGIAAALFKTVVQDDASTPAATAGATHTTVAVASTPASNSAVKRPAWALAMVAEQQRQAEVAKLQAAGDDLQAQIAAATAEQERVLAPIRAQQALKQKQLAEQAEQRRGALAAERQQEATNARLRQAVASLSEPSTPSLGGYASSNADANYYATNANYYAANAERLRAQAEFEAEQAQQRAERDYRESTSGYFGALGIEP